MPDHRPNTHTTILVMYSTDCCLPCHTFEKRRSDGAVLSPQNLQRLFTWAATTQDEVPDLYFLTGAAAPLEPSMASCLEEMADYVVTPLMPVDRQRSLGIPFSPAQTVIAGSLRELTEHAGDIVARPVVVHLEKSELGRLAEELWSMRDALGTLTIRLSDLDCLTEDDIRGYERQLSTLVEKSVLGKGAVRSGAWEIRNVSQTRLPEDVASHCSAGTDMFAFAPDGRLYPCPAFFLSAERCAGLTLDEVASPEGRQAGAAARCGICGRDSCSGCRFLETMRENNDRGCRVSQAERRASRQLWERIVRIPYYFDQMRTLRTTSCVLKSQAEGRECVSAGLQICCVDHAEFVRALQDVHAAARLLTNGPCRPEDYDRIVGRWSDLEGVPVSSQRGVFRRRTRDILEGLLDLRDNSASMRPRLAEPGAREKHWDGPTPGCPLEPRPLTPAAYAEVFELHHRRLGWMYLLRTTTEDRRAGFSCANEEEIIRRKLKDTCDQVSGWFRTTGAAEKWPSAEGWIWEVDFARHRVLPRPAAPADGRAAPPLPLKEGPIMEISEIDVDVIRRLFERRGALADLMRARLGRWTETLPEGLEKGVFRADTDHGETDGRQSRAEDELNTLAGRLGMAQRDVDAWFEEMADIHGWPPLHPPWQYRADFSEHRVYLERGRS